MARRLKSLLQGPQRDGVVWHREHRSKKNRKKRNWSAFRYIRDFKRRKLELLETELDQEMEIYG